MDHLFDLLNNTLASSVDRGSGKESRTGPGGVRSAYVVVSEDRIDVGLRDVKGEGPTIQFSEISNDGTLGVRADVSGAVNAVVEGRVTRCGRRTSIDVKMGDQQSDYSEGFTWNSEARGSNDSKSKAKDTRKDKGNSMMEAASAAMELMSRFSMGGSPDRSEGSSAVNDLINMISEKTEVLKDESISFEAEEETPGMIDVRYSLDGVYGSYRNTLDLLSIDRLICQKLSDLGERLPRIEKEIERFANILIQCPQSRRIRRSIQELQKEALNIITGLKLGEYQKAAKPLLLKYLKIRKSDTPDERLQLILRYLEIARRYIDINLTRLIEDEEICSHCSMSIKGVYPDLNGVLRCPHCGVDGLPLFNEIIQSDSSNSGGKSGYDDIETFDKAIECYIGGQKVEFSPELIEQLDRYFEQAGDPIGEEVREMPLIGDIKGRRRRGRTSRAMMVNALQSTGNTNYYKDSFLLSRHYWGWENPDISKVRNVITADYKVVQIVYNELKGDRKSSLGAGYRLFRHLWHIGFPCHPSEFGIVLTEDIIKFYEETWEAICNRVGKKLGWKPFKSIHVLIMMDPYTLRMPKTF
jgi:hypothetical protein